MYLRAIALALGLFALPLAGEAQPAAKIARIGVLGNSPGPPWEAFRRGLRDLGYIEGQNIAIEWRWTEGRVERAPELAMDLVRLKVDVIVASAPPATRAVQQATTTIPIVFTAVSDPIDSGFVRASRAPAATSPGWRAACLRGSPASCWSWRGRPSLARSAWQSLQCRQPTKLLRSFAPQWAEAAKALKLELQRMDMRRPEDLDSLFSAAHQARVDVVTLVGDPLIFQHRMRIHDLADQYRIPRSSQPRSTWPVAGSSRTARTSPS